MTFEEAKKNTKENFGIILSGIDRLTNELPSQEEALTQTVEYIMGGSTTPGLYNWYCVLALCIRCKYSNVTFMYTPPSSGHSAVAQTLTTDASNGYGIDPFTEMMIGSEDSSTGRYSGGLSDKTDMFFKWNNSSGVNSNDTTFDFTLNNNVFLNHGESHNTEIVPPFTPRWNEARYTFVRQGNVDDGERDVAIYTYGESNRELVNSLTNDIKAWRSFVLSLQNMVTTLRESTQNRLIEALPTDTIDVPSTTTLVNAFNSVVSVLNGSWWNTFNTASTTLSTAIYEEFYIDEIPSAITNYQNALNTLTSSITTPLTNLVNEAVNLMQKASTPQDVTGLRKLWVYWIMQLIGRPSGYLYSYNGNREALEGLEDRRASSEYEVSLIAENNEYLPDPVFNCLYYDEELLQYVLVFTAVLCFDAIAIYRNGTKYAEIPYSQVRDGSEFYHPLTGIESSDILTLKLLRNKDGYSSQESNSLSLEFPNYTS